MRRDPSLIPLSHQHHNGLALCILTDRALAAGEDISLVARRIVDRYEIELVNHFQLEEELLFPALAGVPLVEQLISEHRIITAIVERLRAEPGEEDLREFTAIMRRHIRAEENELFEEAQRLLPREALDQIGLAIEQRVVRVCL